MQISSVLQFCQSLGTANPSFRCQRQGIGLHCHLLSLSYVAFWNIFQICSVLTCHICQCFYVIKWFRNNSIYLIKIGTALQKESQCQNLDIEPIILVHVVFIIVIFWLLQVLLFNYVESYPKKHLDKITMFIFFSYIQQTYKMAMIGDVSTCSLSQSRIILMTFSPQQSWLALNLLQVSKNLIL